MRVVILSTDVRAFFTMICRWTHQKDDIMSKLMRSTELFTKLYTNKIRNFGVVKRKYPIGILLESFFEVSSAGFYDTFRSAVFRFRLFQ